MMACVAKGRVERVLVQMAMDAEARPLIDRLGLKESKDVLPAMAPAQCFVGPCGTEEAKGEVMIVVAAKDKTFGCDSVGTVPAAINTFLAVQAFKPDLVINAGTCGGFKAMGGGIGDVYLVHKSLNHDRRIPIPGFVEYGVDVRCVMPTAKLCGELGFKEGVCSTSNSLDSLDADAALWKEHGATCKEMEFAAVAYVAGQAGTPCFGVKVITDIVDGDKPTQEEFLANLSSAAESLQAAVPRVIARVLGQPLDELR